jgi:hypothetical protein
MCGSFSTGRMAMQRSIAARRCELPILNVKTWLARMAIVSVYGEKGKVSSIVL